MPATTSVVGKAPNGNKITLPHNWRPRAYQRRLWRALERGTKRNIAVWHRRAGKDEVLLHWTAVAAFARPATYWHMLPEYAQGRKAIWTAINPHSGKRRIDEAFPHALRANTNEQEMFIRFKNGATWQVVGSDRYDSTVGSPPAGVTFSEWALADPASWAILAPILAENGGWASFITTPRGRNHAFNMLEMARTQGTWFAEVVTAADSYARGGMMSPEAVEQQRIEYHGIYGIEAGDALIEQEYHCSFEAAVLGSYYGPDVARAEREGHICDVPYDPERPVHVAWDIGVGDSMSMWFFQVYHDHVNVIDHYRSHGRVMKHYVDLKESKKYVYGTDWVPHDAKVREVMDLGDVDQMAVQRLTTMVKLGMRPTVVPDHKVDDGINAVRTLFPSLRFDKTRCRLGLESIRQYRKEWDQKLLRFKDTPLHNWASDDADALRYLAMATRFVAEDEEPQPIKPVKEIGDYTMDQIWKLQPKRRERV